VSGPDDFLAVLAQDLGLDALEWSDRNTLVLEIESSGTLYLERRDAVLLLYLVREIPKEQDLDSVMQRALRLCHYRQGIPAPVYPAMRGDDLLVFLVKIPTTQATLPEFQRVLALLGDLHDKAMES
jgi:type III secretion system chaperone SycN